MNSACLPFPVRTKHWSQCFALTHILKDICFSVEGQTQEEDGKLMFYLIGCMKSLCLQLLQRERLKYISSQH